MKVRARLFTRRRGDLHMKGVGMLVVLLRGVNVGFWSHLACSEESAIICSPFVAVKVSFRVSREQIQKYI